MHLWTGKKKNKKGNIRLRIEWKSDIEMKHSCQLSLVAFYEGTRQFSLLNGAQGWKIKSRFQQSWNLLHHLSHRQDFTLLSAWRCALDIHPLLHLPLPDLKPVINGLPQSLWHGRNLPCKSCCTGWFSCDFMPWVHTNCLAQGIWRRNLKLSWMGSGIRKEQKQVHHFLRTQLLSQASKNFNIDTSEGIELFAVEKNN